MMFDFKKETTSCENFKMDFGFEDKMVLLGSTWRIVFKQEEVPATANDDW